MGKNVMLLAKNQSYSLDCYETKRNNNVVVVAASGAGKTRGIVTPNILQATGSYIISDPKGNLYDKYKDYLSVCGYEVKKLNFINPMDSMHYNFFKYIKNEQDIVRIAHMLAAPRKGRGYRQDPFWDNSGQLLIQALIAYLWESWGPEEQNLHHMFRLLKMFSMESNNRKNALDYLFDDLEEANPDSFAVSCYKMFRIASEKTLRSIIVYVNAQMGSYDTPAVTEMMCKNDVDFSEIGEKKMALFVVVSDTDRSMDNLANIFFTQAMQELCYHADYHCKNQSLPVPVRFILDDFATNCRIDEFPRMIASIRSRNISTMLLIQAESQLKAGYGEDADTIINNCDTYVYMGGNDLPTSEAVAKRCDVSITEILNMPIGKCWIFRRGEKPLQDEIIDLNEYMKAKGISLEEVKTKETEQTKAIEQTEEITFDQALKDASVRVTYSQLRTLGQWMPATAEQYKDAVGGKK